MSDTPKSFREGQVIYLRSSSTWGRDSYLQGVVVRVTPTGKVRVRIDQNPVYEKVFRADGREVGKPYYGLCIDSEMSFAERTKFVRNENLIVKAADAISRIQGRHEGISSVSKGTLDEELDRLQTQINAIRELLGEIE